MNNVELLPLCDDVTGAKAGSSKQSKPTREDDTTATLAKLSILYGLSEGVVRGFGAGSWTASDMKKRIYLDGTPIMSADGTTLHNVEVDFRDGSLDQTAIEGMPSVTVETAVGIEARFGVPVARTFLRKEVNSYVVRISIPRLMRNTEEGDSLKNTVEFAIDVASASGSFSEYGRYTITEKISQGFQRDYSISMPQAASRTIRVRKLSGDGDNNLTFNSIIVEAITEVVEVKLRYPHTAVLWLKYNARDFNNAPKVEILLDGKADLKIPKNYNPDTRVYANTGEGTTNGVWNGEFKLGYTDNPVWHWLDLATNKRYGLGNRITIDIPNKFYLYALAMYCDEQVPDGKGGLEPRFTCNNMYLQKQEDAFTVFKDLSSVFRAKTIWDGTHLTPKMDAPRDAMLVFSRANTNNITYSSISDAAQHNVIAVQYYDTENHYDSAFAYARSVENIQRRGKIEQIEVTALGCTSEGQAQRIADYLLNTELTETEIVSFTTGLDGIRPVVGDVFVFADDLMAGKATSGRVVSVNGAQVTLDRELNPTYDLNGTFIANTTETLASTRTIIEISPDNKTVTLSSPIDVIDITGLVWAVKSDSVGLREFTIDDIGYDAEEHTFTVSGVLYNRNKYSSSDNAAKVVNPPITILQPTTPSSPANVNATYNVVVRQGINVSNIYVTWTQVAKAAKYEIEMRRDGSEWRKLGTLQSLSMTIDNAYAGLYEFRVRSFDVRGDASIYTQSAPLLVAGKTLPPPMLEYFTLVGELFGIRANWVFPAGVTDSLSTRVNIRYTAPTEAGDHIVYDAAYPATHLEIQNQSPNIEVWAQAAIVDRYGIVGAYSPWVSATVDADASKVLDILGGAITESQLHVDLSTKIGTIDTLDQRVDAAMEAVATQGEAISGVITSQTNIAEEQLVISEKMGGVYALTKPRTLDDPTWTLDSPEAYAYDLWSAIVRGDESTVEYVRELIARNNNSAALIQQIEQIVLTETTALAQTIGTVQTTVGENTATIQAQQTSINGINLQYTLKLDVNGYVSGFGMMNDGKTSNFILNANEFALGNPAGTVGTTYPFVFRTTQYTDVSTGTVFPVGAYMKSAFIDYASIKTAHISDLAVKTAKIDDAAITTAKIGDLQVDTLKIKDNAVTVPTGLLSNIQIHRSHTQQPATYSGGNAVLQETSNYFGDVISLTVNRSGGKCKIDGFVYIQNVRAVAYAPGGALIYGEARKNYCGLILYRNGTPIFFARVASSLVVTNEVTVFYGAVALPTFIDDAMYGTATYTLRVGFSSPIGNAGIQLTPWEAGNASVMSSSLSVLELKK